MAGTLTSPVHTLWRGFLLYVLLCSLPGPATSQNEGIYFGLINLQMRSQAATTAQELLFSILSQTTTFLEMALKEKFKSSQYDFTHVTLSVDEFSLDESSDGGKYDADCRLQGIAMFEAGASPRGDGAVKQVVRRALDEENTLFLQALRSSDNPFLQDILFAVVTAEDGDPSFGRPPNATVAGKPSAPDNSAFIAAPWMIALMVTASVGVLMILSCLAWYCYKSCQNARQHDAAVEKMRTASHSSTSSSEEGDAKYRKRSPSIPSPLHSIMSQDSSKFTFNPKSRSTKSIPPHNEMVDDNNEDDDGGEESTSSKHSISFFGVSFYTNSSNVDVDVDAWRKGSTVATSNSNSSLPFGHDISAIEMHSKRDLSLIEEGENEEMTPHSSVSGGSNCFKSKQSLPNPVRLSLQSLAELERDERRRRRSSSRNLRVPPSSQPAALLQQEEKDAVRLSLDGSAAAVIDELNDLSAQIDDYRRR